MTLEEENRLLKAQLIQCTKAMREVSGVLRSLGLPAYTELAGKLEDARATPVEVQDPPRDWVADVLAFMQKLEQRQKCDFFSHCDGGATDLLKLRMSLIHEEYGELVSAVMAADDNQAADALADLIYVAIGMAITFGWDLRPVWEAVHAANMSKAGGPKRADGKILKPEGWKPPGIAAALAKGRL